MTDRTAVPGQAGAERPQRSREFTLLWLGQTVSVFGTQITMLAMSLTAVVYLDAKASQVGLLAAARELAFVGLMLFAGVLVDRHRRRPVMIISDLCRAATVFAVPLLAWAGVLAMPHLYAAAFLLGALAVVFSLAYRAYLPTLVTSDALLVANSRLQTTESLSEVAGPSLAGLLLQLVTAPFALIADGVSFLVSAWSIAAIRTKEPVVVPDGPAEAGFVKGVVAAASLSRTMRIGVGRLLAVSYVVGAAKIVVLPFVGGGPAVRTVLLTVLFFIAGCAVVTATVVEMTIRQAVTPNAMQARVAAAFGFLIGGMTPVAALAAGVLGEWIGPRSTLVVAAVGVPASLPWVLAGRIRRIRSIDEAG